MGLKDGLTPLEKCDFWGFEKLNFLRPKKVSFLSRTLLKIIASLISTKKSVFFDQKQRKCDFWDFDRLNFSWPKNVSFLCRTLLNFTSSLTFTENKLIKKSAFFFYQKHGLTPLDKCDFWDFERLNFSWPKKVYFLSRRWLNIISSLILTENKLITKCNFWPKAWVNPRAKNAILGTLKEGIFYRQ